MILTGFVLLTLTAALSPATGQEIKEITGNSVTLSCPEAGDSSVTWKKSTKEFSNENNDITIEADNGIVKGEFSCKYTIPDSDPKREVEHLFYLDVKVCENCYELSGLMAMSVIFGDLLVTAAVIFIVYLFVPKNTGNTQQKASKSRAQSAPPPPNPDYERLNHNTRSADVYAGLHK